jgi:hypothetical protein
MQSALGDSFLCVDVRVWRTVVPVVYPHRRVCGQGRGYLGRNMDSRAEMRQALLALPGWRIRRSLAGLARTYRLFLGNDRELMSYLAASAQLDRVLELWDLNNEQAFEDHLDEVDRLVHNYLAAASGSHPQRVARARRPACRAGVSAARWVDVRGKSCRTIRSAAPQLHAP